jgi:hypothetical protein
MTEFEIIKNALARVRADLDIYDFPHEKTIIIPINSCFSNTITLELEFDAEGKLTDTFTWE